MNRQIKFRVWHKGKNQWLHKPGQECYILGENILLGGFCNVPLEELNSLEVLQFTGLEDSTGKEIYEGDIVCEKMTNEIAFHGDECNIGRVFFAAGTFMIDRDGPLYDHTHSLTPDKLEDYLVVGNIFETPELLERNSP
jgi:uncharacterized phage protein (TIGR01671 family)